MSTSTGGVGVVVCGECGSANDADVSFCGSCGAYLEWEGEMLEPARPASPVEEVRLFAADPTTAVRGDPTDRIAVDRDALVFSFGHQVKVTRGA